jgi:hypothetical protein
MLQLQVAAISNGLCDFLDVLDTTSGDHHTPTLLADDGAIPVGVKAMSYMLYSYLARHKS